MIKLSPEKIIYYINFIIICSAIIAIIIIQILWNVRYKKFTIKPTYKYEYIIYNKGNVDTPKIRLEPFDQPHYQSFGDPNRDNANIQIITNKEDFQIIKPGGKKTFTIIRGQNDNVKVFLRVYKSDVKLIPYPPGKYIIQDNKLFPLDENSNSNSNSDSPLPYSLKVSFPPFSDIPSMLPFASNKPSMLPFASNKPSMLPFASNKPSLMPSMMPSRMPSQPPRV